MKKVIKEEGRSMVEMLGVLAIIGVLSIGGIAGYTMAMNRYRANQVIDIASKLAVLSKQKGSVNSDYGSYVGLNELNMSPSDIYDIDLSAQEDEDGVYVTYGAFNGKISDGIVKALNSIAGDRGSFGNEGGSIYFDY